MRVPASGVEPLRGRSDKGGSDLGDVGEGSFECLAVEGAQSREQVAENERPQLGPQCPDDHASGDDAVELTSQNVG